MKLKISLLLLSIAIVLLGLRLFSTNSITDKEKIDEVGKLAKQHIYTNPNKALEYADRQYFLANSVNYAEGVAEALSLKGVAYSLQKNYTMALEHQLAALDIEKKLNDYKTIAHSCNQIALIYLENELYDVSIAYNKTALTYWESHFNQVQTAKTAYQIGLAYQKKHNYDQAIYFLQKTHQLAEQLHDHTLILQCKYNQIIIAKAQQKQTDVLFQKQKALNYAEETNQIYWVAKLYDEEGLERMAKKNWKGALESFEQKILWSQHLQIADMIPTLFQISIVKKNQKKYKESLYYLKQVEALAKQFNTIEYTVLSKKEQSNLYAQQGIPEAAFQALHDYDKANQKWQQQKHQQEIKTAQSKLRVAEFHKHYIEEQHSQEKKKRHERWLAIYILISFVTGITLYRGYLWVKNSYTEYKQKQALRDKIITHVSKFMEKEEDKGIPKD